MNRIFPLAREAFASAISSPVGSVLTVLVIASMCASVILTSGRTAGAQQAVIQRIDSVGTRSIIIRAEQEAGLDTSVLTRLNSIEGIESVVAASPPRDVQNADIPGGSPVSARFTYGDGLLGQIEPRPTIGDVAFAPPDALTALGLARPTGAVSDVSDGMTVPVVGSYSTPDFLEFMGSFVAIPKDDVAKGDVQPISVLVVVAASPELVATLQLAVESVLDVSDRAKISVETSESLALLRGLIDQQLSAFGFTLVIGIIALTSILVAAILSGVVLLRRKDFGRRRALGATRQFVVGLVVAQTAVTSAVGAAFGCLVGAAALFALTDPLPDAKYFTAVAVIAIGTGIVASIIPAGIAANRDPLRELRVP